MPITATNAPLTLLALTGNTNGDNVVIAGVTGQVIRVYAYWATAAGATTLQFKDGATVLSGAMTMATGQPVTVQFTSVSGALVPIFSVSAGTGLNMALTSVNRVSGQLWYTQD